MPTATENKCPIKLDKIYCQNCYFEENGICEKMMRDERIAENMEDYWKHQQSGAE